MRTRATGLVALTAVVVTGAALASPPHRIEVKFATAPVGPVSAFAAISRNNPAIVLTARARRVAMIHWHGARALLLAPTKGGGFCESLAGAYGGSRCVSGTERIRQKLNSGLTGDGNGPLALNGSFSDPRATRLELSYEDGRSSIIPIIWVSAPIRAGFFVFPIPHGHRQPGHRPKSLTLYSASGTTLAAVTLG